MRADNEDIRHISQLTDRLQFDGEKGLSHLVGDLAPVVPVVPLAELLDDEAAPDDVPLLALHYGEVGCLTASPQLLALHGRGSNIFKKTN